MPAGVDRLKTDKAAYDITEFAEFILKRSPMMSSEEIVIAFRAFVREFETKNSRSKYND